MTPPPCCPTSSWHYQHGATLIEVLVSILLLSFGLLSLGALMGYATQAPKLSSYRAAAANLANNYIERIRANPNGFTTGSYSIAMTFDATYGEVSPVNCGFPNCDAAGIATMDTTAIHSLARRELPAGGYLMTCDGTCTLSTPANLWIIWLEPESVGGLNAAASDLCPSEVTSTYTNPAPRCLYVRFKV